MTDRSEIETLVREYDPSNSDWNFRKGVIMEVLSRIPDLAQAEMNLNALEVASKVMLEGHANCNNYFDPKRNCDCDLGAIDGCKARREAIAAAITAAQAAADCCDVIDRCAKIAEPWPGFWLDDSSTEADRAVVAVRTEIAAKIRAMAKGNEKCA